MHRGSHILWECSAQSAILPWYFNCVKMTAFQFYLRSGKQRKVRWVGDDSHVIFGKKNSLVKKTKCETVRCCDSTASCFVVKVRGEVFSHFHPVAVTSRSSMRNWMFGLPDEFFVNNSFYVKEIYEHALNFAPHLSRLSRSRRIWTFRVLLMLCSPNACLITSKVSAHFFWDLHRIWCCSFVGYIAKSHQERSTTPNRRTLKISTCTDMRESLHTDSQDMLLLSSTISSRCYNCYTDGSTSPENYGYSQILCR
jgi:hypothetical protein